MNIFEQNKDTEFHFMVDIETLATSNNAAITEIGAASINSDPIVGLYLFHGQCVDNEGERSIETIHWRTENNLPWITTVSSQTYSLANCLSKFFKWVTDKAGSRTPILWCKGTDFDAVILKNAADRCGLALPWKYNSIRDVRTLLQFFPQFKVPKEEVTHNALEDAILQRNYLLKIANEIGLGIEWCKAGKLKVAVAGTTHG